MPKTKGKPPQIKSYSADEFRQWLAGLTEDRDDMDYEELKPLLYEFISILPLVYSLKERLEMWSRISEHMVSAADACGDDISIFLDDLRERLGGDVARMLSAEVAAVLDKLYELDPQDRRLCLRIIRDCPSELVIVGRNRWQARNAK